jgi:hypothetical protein
MVHTQLAKSGGRAVTRHAGCEIVRKAPHSSPAARLPHLFLAATAAWRTLRSDAVALDVADLGECPEPSGHLRRSKTDQEGAGAVVVVCRGSIACPVAAVSDWLSAAGVTEGALFRRVGEGDKVIPDRLRAQSVAFIVKAYGAPRAGC